MSIEDNIRQIIREENEKVLEKYLQRLDKEIDSIRKELLPEKREHSNENVIYGKKAAAEEMRVSRPWLDKIFKRGLLQEAVLAEDVGGRIRFDRQKLQQIIAELSKTCRNGYINQFVD